jgi:DDE superfamily endonuclease
MLPISLRRLLDAFDRCFTTPTFEVFQAMVLGLVAQTGQRTVCGMLTGAGLATSWSHDRAHRFFSTARWSIDQIGLTVFDLVLAHLVTDGSDLLLAVDDTAHRRRGKKVHGAGWIHDGWFWLTKSGPVADGDVSWVGGSGGEVGRSSLGHTSAVSTF